MFHFARSEDDEITTPFQIIKGFLSLQLFPAYSSTLPVKQENRKEIIENLWRMRTSHSHKPEKIEEAIKRNKEGLWKSVDFFLRPISFSKTNCLKTTTKMLLKLCVSAQAVLWGADTSAVSMTLAKNVSVYKENKVIKKKTETGLPMLSLACFAETRG